MTCLNTDKTPKENDEKFLDYGKNDISMLYDFYGKQRDDVFEGREVTILPILAVDQTRWQQNTMDIKPM